MAPPNLLPDPTQLELISLMVDHQTKQMTAYAATTGSEAMCPVCQQASHRVHSRYSRQWAGLPLCGQSIRWIVEVRRFRCWNPDCIRKISCERLPSCAPAYDRRMVRGAR